MTFQAFEKTVAAMVEEIPPEFLEGLQGVHVLKEARRERGYRDVWRMGEYLDPGAENFLGGNPGLGRHIALYYGSFQRVATGDDSFDWDEEIWETLTHELRHHVESLAGDVSLIEWDKQQKASFSRDE